MPNRIQQPTYPSNRRSDLVSIGASNEQVLRKMIQQGLTREEAVKRGFPLAAFDAIAAGMGAAGMGAAGKALGATPANKLGAYGQQFPMGSMHGVVGAGVGGAAGLVPETPARKKLPPEAGYGEGGANLNEQRRLQDQYDAEYELEQWKKYGGDVTPSPQPPPKPPMYENRRTGDPEKGFPFR